MSTEKILKVSSSGLEDTSRIAAELASELKGGEVITLTSDLGGGKTTFTSYLVEALGTSDDISSPTFTVQNIYKLDNHPTINEVHHFDFYRLAESGMVGLELEESVTQSDVVSIIEWPGIVLEDISPTIEIDIKSTSDTTRQFTMTRRK